MTEDRGSGGVPVASAGTEGRNGSLRRGALGLPAAVMQGVSHIAPAVGMVLTLQFITSLAGLTAPLSYALAFVIVLTLGIALTQLAKYLPSAGGYYTYVSRTVHPRAGFLTAWLFFLYDPTGAAIN
jgi:amino acid transporter